MTPTMRQTNSITPEPGGVLTYSQSYQLMNDPDFRGRVQVSCLTYAQQILLEPTQTAGHNTRVRWAQSVQQSPAMIANNITPKVVMNINVQTTGSDVTDMGLQSALQYEVDGTF